MGWRRKSHTVCTPFVEFGGHIFGDEVDIGVATNQSVRVTVGLGLGQREAGIAVGGRDLNPSASGRENLVDDQAETELVGVETQASLLIANENHDKMQADVGVLLIEAQNGFMHPER